MLKLSLIGLLLLLVVGCGDTPLTIEQYAETFCSDEVEEEFLAADTLGEFRAMYVKRLRLLRRINPPSAYDDFNESLIGIARTYTNITVLWDRDGSVMGRNQELSDDSRWRGALQVWCDATDELEEYPYSEVRGSACDPWRHGKEIWSRFGFDFH